MTMDRNPFSLPSLAEYGPDWASRERTMRADLERGVDLAGGIRKSVMALPEDLPTEKVDAELDALWRRALARFPSEDVQPAVEFAALGRERDRLSAEMTRVEQGKVMAILHDWDAVDRQMGTIIRRRGTMLLSRIDEFLRSLRKKNRLVVGFRNNPQELVREFNRIFYSDRRRSGATEDPSKERLHCQLSDLDLRYTPFSVTAILRPEKFNVIGSAPAAGDRVGTQAPYSVFSAVSSAARNVDETIAHERIHNLTETFPSFHRTEYRYITDIQTCRELQDGGEDVWPSYDDLLERIWQLTPRSVVDSLEYEWIAEMENAERRDFGLGTRSRKDGPLLPEERVSVGANALSTAGDQWKGFVESVEHEIWQTRDDYYAGFLADLQDGAQRLFVRSLRALQEAFVRARRSSDPRGAHDRILDACVVLRPSQYYHLPGLILRGSSVHARRHAGGGLSDG